MIFNVIVEVTDAEDEVHIFLGDRVLKDNVAVPRPVCFIIFLEFFETFVVEPLFVPAVLSNEPIEGPFPAGWRDFVCDAPTVLLLTVTRLFA
jgi:hypothetical protein